MREMMDFSPADFGCQQIPVLTWHFLSPKSLKTIDTMGRSAGHTQLNACSMAFDTCSNPSSSTIMTPVSLVTFHGKTERGKAVKLRPCRELTYPAAGKYAETQPKNPGRNLELRVSMTILTKPHVQ